MTEMDVPAAGGEQTEEPRYPAVIEYVQKRPSGDWQTMYWMLLALSPLDALREFRESGHENTVTAIGIQRPEGLEEWRDEVVIRYLEEELKPDDGQDVPELTVAEAASRLLEWARRYLEMGQTSNYEFFTKVAGWLDELLETKGAGDDAPQTPETGEEGSGGGDAPAQGGEGTGEGNDEGQQAGGSAGGDAGGGGSVDPGDDPGAQEPVDPPLEGGEEDIE